MESYRYAWNVAQYTVYVGRSEFSKTNNELILLA